MKLNEIKTIEYDLVVEFERAWQDEPLSEGIWDSMRGEFGRIANTFSQVYKKSNTKSGLNDVVLSGIYREELKSLKIALSKAPLPIQQKLIPILAKHNIKISGGVDLSRKHLNRIMIIKIIRGLLYAMSQMKDNGIQWLLSTVVSGGILAIISLIMNAKDFKEIGAEFIKSSKQIKALIDKANE